MKTAVECIPCLINQGIKVSKFNNISDEKTQELIKEILSKLSTEKILDTTPPHLAKDIYKIISKYNDNSDPYKEIKEYYNNEIMAMAPKLKLKIEDSSNPLFTAIKLAVTGNIIDFGTNHSITEEIIREKIEEIEHKNFAIDDTTKLYNKLKTSKTLLYLGDNCGEIVFDKLLIEEIKKEFPNLHITFAVRGNFVINDVTTADAKQVGMYDIVDVIDNGDNAPGTIIENCSKEFMDRFNNSDLIISKGQGNFETLNLTKRDDIYFLFMTKCRLVTKNLNVPMFSLMCKKK